MDQEAILNQRITEALGSVPPVSEKAGLLWGSPNHPHSFLGLASEERDALLAWIDRHVVARKTVNRSFTSYGLKHEFDDKEAGGFYVVNGAFKGAMIVAGHLPHDWNAVNPHYRIGAAKPQKETRQ